MATVLAALAMAGVAGAASSQAPDWASKPDAEDLADYYPPIAQALNIEGRAVIGCRVDAEGFLEACESLTASPAGLGFGEAAVAMGSLFEMRPRMVDGKPAGGGQIRIPIRFALPPPAQRAATAAGPAPSPAALVAARRAGERSGLDVGLILSREAELRLMAQDSAAMDPAKLADALAALRAANFENHGRVADAVALGIASRLSPAEVTAWLAYLDSAAARKLGQSDKQIQSDLRSITVLHNRIAAVRAREMFCGRQDCTVELTLADMRRLADAPEATVINPRWSQEPSKAQVAAAYPFIAQLFRLKGWSVLQCRVTEAASLEACESLVQTPSRLGFRLAAEQVSGLYRLAPDLMAQGAAGDRVNLTGLFSIEEDSFPPSAPPAPSAALNLAREIVRFQGAARQAEQTADLAQMLLAQAPGPDAAVRRDASEAYRGALIEDLPDRLDAMAEVYTKHLTESELRTVRTFAHSRTGQVTTGRDDVFNALMSQAMSVILAQEGAEARAVFCRTHDCGPGQ